MRIFDRWKQWRQALKALAWVKSMRIPGTMEFSGPVQLTKFGMEFDDEWRQVGPRRFTLPKNILFEDGDSLLATFPRYTLTIDGIEQPPMRVALIPTAVLTRLRKERAVVLGVKCEEVEDE
jgi:hypothetical protein